MQGLLTIYPGNHTVFELQDLTDVVTGDAQTTATVTVTLQTAAGVDVGGQTWPAPMAHVAAGTYRATLDADLDLTHAARYVAVVDVLTAGGVIGHWEAPVVARTRTS